MARKGFKAMRAFARFGRARRGAALVEFALVAPWFFLLTFGLAEVAMLGFAQTSLDFAVADTARSIRTGAVQTQDIEYEELRTGLCDKFNTVMHMNCDNLYLDVDRFDSFIDAQNEDPVQNGEFEDDNFGFDPGAPSDIVVVRTYYRWEIMTPFFQGVFSNVGSTQRILSSTMMFRNEPFPP
jgi:Flp pilus assembly protein TadG